MLEQDGGVGGPLVRTAGAIRRGARARVRRSSSKRSRKCRAAEPSRACRGARCTLLQKAEDEAKALKDDFVSVEHFLLAAARPTRTCRRSSIGTACRYDKLLAALADVRGASASPIAIPKGSSRRSRSTRAISPSSRANGKIDPVIGRDEEIRRVMQVLSRRTKNNPVLIGEPGVGKTAIVEGIAQRIVRGRRARVAQGQAARRARSGGDGRRRRSSAASSRIG